MTNNVFKNNYHILLWSLLLFSIYIGFFLSENITQGPKLDFEHALKQVEIFEKDGDDWVRFTVDVKKILFLPFSILIKLNTQQEYHQYLFQYCFF